MAEEPATFVCDSCAETLSWRSPAGHVQVRTVVFPEFSTPDVVCAPCWQQLCVYPGWGYSTGMPVAKVEPERYDGDQTKTDEGT